MAEATNRVGCAEDTIVLADKRHEDTLTTLNNTKALLEKALAERPVFEAEAADEAMQRTAGFIKELRLRYALYLGIELKCVLKLAGCTWMQVLWGGWQ